MQKIISVSVMALMMSTSIGEVATASDSPFIYRYRNTEIIGASTGTVTPPPTDPTDDDDTDNPGPGDDGDPDDTDPGGTDPTDPSDPEEPGDEEVCGEGSDIGALGRTDWSDDDDRGDLEKPTMYVPDPEPAYSGTVRRCFRFSGGYGNYTVSTNSWGDSEWLDYQEVVPMDAPQLPWERPGYGLTASYPSNSAFPRRVTSGERYCVVYRLNGTLPEDFEGWSLNTAVSISDYAPEDMEGDRAKIMADRSNGLDFGLGISRADVMRAIQELQN